jgi:hypothetical protein
MGHTYCCAEVVTAWLDQFMLTDVLAAVVLLAGQAMPCFFVSLAAVLLSA